jgi:succinate dehydrogenase/fumarate reductase-like Fe-S protein
MTDIEKNHMTLRVKRGGPDEAPRHDSFEVPYSPGASVLDALIWIRRDVDPTLAVRYSCVSANACRECMVLVDGKVEYACTTRLMPGTMTVDPLPKKRLIRDLVTDIVPPKERLDTVVQHRTKKS